MAIEIEPSARLSAQRALLHRVHDALSSAGFRPVLSGAGAVTWGFDLELPVAWPLRWRVDGDRDRARRLVEGLRLDPGAAVAFPAIAISSGADDSAETSGVRPPGEEAEDAGRGFVNVKLWALRVGPGGELVGQAAAEAELATGTLHGERSWAGWLRGNGERLLELAALAAATGLRPPPEIVQAMRRDALHVLGVDRVRWAHWFGALLTGTRPSVGLQLLFDAGALSLILPEAALLFDFHRSAPAPHKDIWDHTLQVVDKCPPELVVRWAALMHDVGKVWTRSVGKRGKIQFLRHEELGASLMEGAAGRFHLDADLAHRVCYVIGNHARANVYATNWTDSAVRRLIRDMGEHLDAVLAFSRSDFTTKRAWRIREVRELGEELVRRIEEVRAADAKPAALPKGFGTLVLARTGRRPGPWLGIIQRMFEDEVESGRLTPSVDAEASWAWLLSHRPELLSEAEPAVAAPGRADAS